MPTLDATFRDDPLNRYAFNIIDKHMDDLQKEYGIQMPPVPQDAKERPIVPISKDYPKVGIIGAGIGGLYAAMLLQERGIPYEILEASPRLGGRLYTHRMGERPNDYYVSVPRVWTHCTHMITRMSVLCASPRLQ